jgi:hypothetical protein
MPDWLVVVLALAVIVLGKTVAVRQIATRVRSGRLGIRAAEHLAAATIWLPITLLALWLWGPTIATLAAALVLAATTTLAMPLFRPFFEDLARTPDAR